MQTFLTKIKHILEKNEEIAKLKHESFNIFSILRKEKEEERLHSAFLAALLDVNGGHGMGSVFCQLFVDQFDEITFTVDESVKVHVEKSVREGRLDICLENGLNEVVVIENKLDAKDQPKQLIRYFDYLQRRKCKNSLLFYLTLNRKEPNEISITDEDQNDKTKIRKLMSRKDFHLISYESDILEWLEACIKEAAEVPTVRETIKQYILLVKKITGQLTNQIMSKEVDNSIKKNFKSAKVIAENWERVYKAEAQDFINRIYDIVRKELDVNSWVVKIGNVSTNYDGISLFNKAWDENIKINLVGNMKLYKDPSYLGLFALKSEWDREDLFSKIGDQKLIADGVENEYWPSNIEVFNFGSNEGLKILFDAADEKEKLIKALSDQLIAVATACGDKLKGIKKAKN